MGETVSVWLVDKTFSDDEQNLIIATYATEDGTRAYRKELAVTSMGGGFELSDRAEVAATNLSSVDDPETRSWYREAVATRQDAAAEDRSKG